MSKPLLLVLAGLSAYIIVAGVFFYVSIPVMHLAFFTDNPDAQKSLNSFLWVIIWGLPALPAAGVLRFVYEILYPRPRKRRR